MESNRTERKSSIANKVAFYRQIALRQRHAENGEPGILFVGVDDKGVCANLKVTDELLLQLADIRSNGNILQFPSMSVQKRTICNCDLAVIVVQPSDTPPVRYDGRIWIRVGPRRAAATAEEERRLNEKRRARDLPFDLRSVPSSSKSDFDLELFERTYLPAAVAKEVLEQNERGIEQQLASVRFITADMDAIPTVVGLLTVGKSPADFIAGAYIQFLRIQGTSLSDPIADQKECHGPLPDLLRQIDGILKANIRIATDIKSHTLEKQSPDYPLVALQQYMRNAAMHRDYETSNAPIRFTWFSDRIEIQNPGGPYGQVTRQNFGQAGITDYRNPNIAEVMKTLGFVQRFGVGLETARKALEVNGNPPPDFRVEENHVLVVVSAKGRP